MYEKLLNKFVKIVWIDNGRSKAVGGFLKDVEDTCLGIETKDGQNIVISREVIVSVKELGGFQ